MKIASDKWKHFFVGLAMGILFQLFLHWFLPGHLILSTVLVFIMVAVISYGFELYSKFTGHGHYEVMDAVAAVIGGLLGIGFILLLQLR